MEETAAALVVLPTEAVFATASNSSFTTAFVTRPSTAHACWELLVLDALKSNEQCENRVTGQQEDLGNDPTTQWLRACIRNHAIEKFLVEIDQKDSLGSEREDR